MALTRPRDRMRTRCQRPRSLAAIEIEDEMALGVALVRVAFRGSAAAIPQIITVPPPYSPSGMVPSNALYSIG